MAEASEGARKGVPGGVVGGLTRAGAVRGNPGLIPGEALVVSFLAHWAAGPGPPTSARAPRYRCPARWLQQSPTHRRLLLAVRRPQHRSWEGAPADCVF